MQYNIPSPEELQGDILVKPAMGVSAQNTLDVTVVTVCFNPLKAGRRALFTKNLDSVQWQKGVCLEHLIIDGASSDGTLDFLKAYKNINHEMRILSKADSGIYDAMNRGVALAKGKYVIFLNSDDHYHDENGLTASMKALEETGCSFSFAPILAEKENGRLRRRRPQCRLHKAFLFNVICHQSMMFRKNELFEMGGYDLAYGIASDYDLMMRLVASGHKGCFVNHSFVTFEEGGFAMQNKKENMKEKARITRNFHREALGLELSEEECEFLVRKCRYPRKYISAYIKTQHLKEQAFMGLPQDLANRLIRSFNYYKYYLRCFLP